MSSSTGAAPRFIPFKLSFWERCFGSTFLEYELARMKEFAQAKDSKQVKISGYAKKIGDDSFLLLPTLYTPQVSLPCVVASGHLPPDNAYVTVEGLTEWGNLRRSLGREFEADKVLSVQTWSRVTPEYDVPRPKMDFAQFKDSAFGHIINLDPIVKDFVAYQMVSCPDFEGFLGGLNISLYDKTAKRHAQAVAKNIGMIVPRDIGSPYTLSTPFGEVKMRYRFNFLQIDADKALSSGLREVMTNRHRDTSLSELSISLSSANSKPKTLEEPPCSLVDFPTVLNEDVDLVTAKVDPDLDAFKYMLYQHLTAPIVDDSATILRDLSEKLVELPKRFEIPSDMLARCKLLDASYVGRPQSILRLALATGRATGQRTVGSADAIKVYNEYFLTNFDNVIHAWSESDLFAQKGIPLAKLSGDERKIFRLIERYESTDRKHATYQEIAEETKMDDYVLRQVLFDMVQRKGILIESSPMCYRTIPDVST